jgi:hypothetical protein
MAYGAIRFLPRRSIMLARNFNPATRASLNSCHPGTMENAIVFRTRMSCVRRPEMGLGTYIKQPALQQSRTVPATARVGNTANAFGHDPTISPRILGHSSPTSVHTFGSIGRLTSSSALSTPRANDGRARPMNDSTLRSSRRTYEVLRSAGAANCIPRLRSFLV